MRASKPLSPRAFAVGCAGVALLFAPPIAARPALKAPVHPDTLATLIRSWSLPASLAPSIKNAYAPRMLLSGKLLYIYDHHGRRIVAVQAASGKVAWHRPVPTNSDRAFAFTPLVAGNRVFVASDGYIHCFKALDGKPCGQIRTKGVAINGMARSKHRLFLPWLKVDGHTAQPGVYIWAIDARRGHVEWSHKFPGALGFVEGDSSGPYYVSNTGVVMGLTPDRGDPRWQLRVKGQVLRPPILEGGRLYVVSRYRKAGWNGHLAFAIDAAKGKLLWKVRIPTPELSFFLYDKQLTTVDGSGKLKVYSGSGKPVTTIDLAFDDPPLSLHGAVSGDRIFVFSSHADGNGFVRLVDMKRKRLLARANALDMKVRSLASGSKMVYLDGADGNVYAYRLDRSERPARRSVPAPEFAQELIDNAARRKHDLDALHLKLAGLGPKALPTLEKALGHTDGRIAAAVARAVGLLGKRRSAPALLSTLSKLRATAPKGHADPAIAVIEALARLRDNRAVADLKAVLLDAKQGDRRRRAAYVALGAIGSARALAPIWTLRAEKALETMKWSPVWHTASLTYRVERDYDPNQYPAEVRKKTARTVQNAKQRTFTASLSPYLGGYNDIWVGESDLAGRISKPLFTGLTKAEVRPHRFIRFAKLHLKGDQLALTIRMRRGKKWVKAHPVKLSLAELARDSDGDGLSDVIERRLHTCVYLADCDGDGIKDSEDVNPLASGKIKATRDQQVFREAFFAYFAFFERRGVVVIDPGEGASFEVYGRQDPVLALRRSTIEDLRKDIGLHALDVVSFGGPYPEGAGSGDALPAVSWDKHKRTAKLGMDVVRSGDNAIAYNVTVKRHGHRWVVTRLHRVWVAKD